MVSHLGVQLKREYYTALQRHPRQEVLRVG